VYCIGFLGRGLGVRFRVTGSHLHYYRFLYSNVAHKKEKHTPTYVTEQMNSELNRNTRWTWKQ